MAAGRLGVALYQTLLLFHDGKAGLASLEGGWVH